MQQPLEHWSMALRSGDLSGAVWSPAWWSRLSSSWEAAQLQKVALSIIHDMMYFFLLSGWVWVEWRKGDFYFFLNDSYLRLGASWGQAQDKMRDDSRNWGKVMWLGCRWPAGIAMGGIKQIASNCICICFWSGRSFASIYFSSIRLFGSPCHKRCHLVFTK